MAKRGRPAVFSEEYMRAMAQVFPLVKTRRGLQDSLYSFVAMKALKEAEGTEYLCDFFTGNDVKARTSVLAQLGRLHDPALIREYARQVYDHVAKNEGRFNAKEYVETLRYVRKRISEAASENANG